MIVNVFVNLFKYISCRTWRCAILFLTSIHVKIKWPSKLIRLQESDTWLCEDRPGLLWLPPLKYSSYFLLSPSSLFLSLFRFRLNRSRLSTDRKLPVKQRREVNLHWLVANWLRLKDLLSSIKFTGNLSFMHDYVRYY